MPTTPPLYRQPGVANGDELARRRDQRRGSARKRGYDYAWERVREKHLKAEPLCRFCLARGLVVAANEVDHIEPIARAPELRLVDANLRSLCKACHSARTAAEQAAILAY